MPSTTVEHPSPVNRVGSTTIPGKSLATPPGETAEGKWDVSHVDLHDCIERAIQQIHGADDSTANNRWQKRVAFVRPARIVFSSRDIELPFEAVDEAEQDPDVSWEIVTTDLSLEGAGILCYGRDELLPSHVTLVIDDTAFDCDVRWTTRIGHRVYRYGLLFRGVRGAAPKRL